MSNYRRLRWESHLPHSQKIVTKKNSVTEYDDFVECANFAERDDLTVRMLPSLWSMVSSVESEVLV